MCAILSRSLARSGWGPGGGGGGGEEDAVVAEQLAIEEAIQFSLALEESKRQYEADTARRHQFTGVGPAALPGCPQGV